MGLLESIRKWIDGEGVEDPLASMSDAAKPRRIWEEFLVKVAREVEAVMQREMFTPPGGPTYIPREYIVYLSPDDDKEWQGDKRRGLEQGLFHVLSERARELSGRTELAAKSFAVELRVDGTLNKGEFRVQPVWDPAESGHTQVTARPAKSALPAATTPPPPPKRGHRPRAATTRGSRRRLWTKGATRNQRSSARASPSSTRSRSGAAACAKRSCPSPKRRSPSGAGRAA